MGTFAQVYMGLLDQAWSVARDEMRRSGRRVPEDALPESMDREDRRLAHLEMLRVYSQMALVLKQNIEGAEMVALTSGATYADVAAAEGVTRQAVRQRHDRLARSRKPRAVRLKGGPCNGDQARVGNESVIRKTVEVFAGHPDEYDEPRWYARYVRSRDDPNSFVFVRIEEIAHLD